MPNRLRRFSIWAAILNLWLALSLFPCGPSGAAGLTVLRGDGLVIVCEQSLETVAGHIKEAYPAVKGDLESILAWKLESEPAVRLVGSRDVFEQMTGSPHFSAFAVPSEHLIVMFVSPAAPKPLAPNETFKHELCHLLLHDHIPGSRIPKWLDEGVCQWASGSFGEILSGGRFPATAMALVRSPIPLRQLSYSFPSDGESLALAYEESRQFVDYLTATYGNRSLLAILNRLAEGDEVEQAVAKTLSKSLETVEAEWIESIRSRGVWFIWASQYLYEILFFAAALLTVAAAIRAAVKKRRYAGEEDEEEDGE